MHYLVRSFSLTVKGTDAQKKWLIYLSNQDSIGLPGSTMALPHTPLDLSPD
jgi:hypothetical protein